MLFVDNAGVTNPRVNLAIEEHLVRNVAVDEPILMFYVNEPSVILGRNQNTHEEIDPDFVKMHGIHVVRRLSGGGAVFHDFGNLNFSFITNGRQDLHNFHKFTLPVVTVLRDLGVNAELRAKSSLFANGKKISGNAQFLTGDRMVSHGTLLFDSNLEMLLRALNPRQVQITSNAVQSVRSQVMNLRDVLPPEMDIDGLRAALLQGVFGGAEIPVYVLTDEDWLSINKLVAERYDTWAWNVGRSPKFCVEKSGWVENGRFHASITIEKGHIKTIEFNTEFSDERLLAELKTLLMGVRYEKGVLTEAVQDLQGWSALEKSKLIDLLY